MIVLAGIFGIFMLGQMQIPLTAKPPIQLVGKGNTHSVQIAVNGKPEFNGIYKKIPFGMHLPSGRHLLTARRDGYFLDRAQVNIKPGSVLEEVTFNLRPKADFAHVAVSANWTTSPTVVVNFNEGFYVARLETSPVGEGKAHAIPDLQVGTEYRVTASVADDGRRRDVACRFTPTQVPNGQSTILHIDFVAKNCTIFIR